MYYFNKLTSYLTTSKSSFLENTQHVDNMDVLLKHIAKTDGAAFTENQNVM